jgi:hypothetical protein
LPAIFFEIAAIPAGVGEILTQIPTRQSISLFGILRIRRGEWEGWMTGSCRLTATLKNL